MNNNEQIVAIPCNDHAIFFDKWGVLYSMSCANTHPFMGGMIAGCHPRTGY